LSLRDDLLERFEWVDGHADVWRLFSDGALLPRIVAALAEPFRDATKVAGVEARGFILGGAVATELGAGFVAIRKEAGLFPGDKISRKAQVDYRGTEHTVRLQRGSLGPADRVVLVDDWAERGAQALAARELVEESGATFAGLSLLVDQLEGEVRKRIGRVHSLVRAEELGAPLRSP
jgi:adenine phosphoribosyltransferase